MRRPDPGFAVLLALVPLSLVLVRPAVADTPELLFAPVPGAAALSTTSASDAIRLDVDHAAIARVLSGTVTAVRLPLPGARTLDVDLEPMALLPPNARVLATGDAGTDPVGIEFQAFRGAVRGEPGTRVILSFAGGRANVLIDRGAERFAILPDARGYTLAASNAGGERPGPPCSTPDGIIPAEPAAARRASALAAQSASKRYYCEMAIDCDYEFFANVHGGDLTAATQYALTLFAAISPTYERDVNVELRVVYLHVWTTPNDPYTATDAASQFYEFQSNFSVYNPGVTRSLAHLLSGRPFGGYAWLSGTFCSGFGYAVSGVQGGLHPYDIYLVSHEVGHNFGAEHTHSCFWRDGGFSAGPLDSCVVDPCSPGPFTQPINGGTLMSYCWPVRTEFHQHPRTIMRGRVETSCLVFQSDAVLPPTNLRATSLSGSVRLTWTPSGTAGVIGYEIYRSTSSLDLNPLLVGTTSNIWWTDPYAGGPAYYKLKAVMGQARSAFSGETRAAVCGLEAPGLHVAGNAPSDLVVADFDEDGMLDIAFTDWATSRIGVVRGTGLDGSGRATFGAPTWYATNAQPVSIAHADFNEDGILDLAVVQESAGRLSILTGLGSGGVGNGSFGPRADFIIGALPRDIEIADFNEDGILDVATVQQLGDRLAILDGRGTAGVGDGTFGSPRTFYVADDPRGLAAGDFDRDGILDIAVAKLSGLRVMRGTGTGGVGDGSFGFMFQSGAGALPGCSEVLAADFNGDALLDLAVLKNTMSSIVIMSGNGAGGFTQTAAYPVGYGPEHMIRTDTNADGRLDLVATNAGSFTATVLPGLSGGTFGPGRLLECGNNPGGLAGGDFDGDGFADLAIACEGSDHIALYPSGCPDYATPVAMSALGAEVIGDRVRVAWSVVVDDGAPFDVLRSVDGAVWIEVARLLPDGSGRVTYDDMEVEPGRRYGYALRTAAAAAPVGITWIDVPAWPLWLSVRPNPSRGAPLDVEFTLPANSPGRLELLDIGGRRIDAVDIGAFGAGRHATSLGSRRTLPPGRYLVRLMTPGETRTTTVTVIR